MNAWVVRVSDSGWCHKCGGFAQNVADGTNKWTCRDCIALELRAAEAVLWPDREFHRNHDVKQVGCPFCYPGAVA